MGYPTHVDPGSRHIRIHKDETCGYVRRRRNEKHTTWFEGFDSVEAAEELARSKGYKIQYCKRCFCGS